MTCNNCIHGDMCANRNKMVQIDEHTWDEFELTDNVENLCDHFKDKKDFVEVVRCKDCDVPHNRWTGCPNLNGLIPPPDFYCAKGKRK